MSPRKFAIAILLGGLIAGTVDIGAAVLISGKDALFILKFIVAGLIGKAALTAPARRSWALRCNGRCP